MRSVDLDIRFYEEADFASMMALVTACYGAAAEPPEWWRWRHFSDGPAHATTIALVIKGSNIVGMQPMSYFTFRMQQLELIGGLLTGVMVHPNFRGKGLFRALVKKCLESAWSHGAHFVTTMPNKLSFPLFQQQGWINPGLRTLLLRPLSLGLLSLIPGFSLSWRSVPSISVIRTAGFSSCADELIEKVSQSSERLQVQRDAQWLNWRYRGNPLVDYRLFEARSTEGALDGIAVSAAGLHRGLKIGYIIDLLGDNDNVRRHLISAVVKEWQQEGVQLVATVISNPEYIADLRRRGFVKVPPLLSPKKFYTMYMPNPSYEGMLHPLRDIRNWHQTLGDWDGI